MRTITFNSYKGGMGRSTVLHQTAQRLADFGYQVVILDLDLEAPGIGAKFGKSPFSYPAAGPSEVSGIIDVLSCIGPAIGASKLDPVDFSLLAKRFEELLGTCVDTVYPHDQARATAVQEAGSVRLIKIGTPSDKIFPLYDATKRHGYWHKVREWRTTEFTELN